MEHKFCLSYKLLEIFKSRFYQKIILYYFFLNLILILPVLPEGVESNELFPLKIHVTPDPFVKIQDTIPKAIIVTDLATQVVITCHSSYPVLWSLEKYRYGSFPSELKSAIKFGSKREFKDFWNPSTYSYTSTMTLQASTNKLTGNYSCKSVDKLHLGQDYIYVYWEGSSGSYLLQAGENRKITVDPNDKHFQLYCGTSKPNVQVYLFQGQEHLIPDNQTVFQDVDGFLVDLSLLKEFKRDNNAFICSLKSRYNPNIDDTSEIARFEIMVFNNNVKKEVVKLLHFHTMTQDSKGLVNYDTTINNLICCSQRADEHRQVGYYCQNPSECGFYYNRLMWGDNAQDRNSTCSWYTEGFRGDNGAVVFRCDNRNDLEAEAEKFYGLNAKSYLNIEEASREKWNVIRLEYNTTKEDRLIGSSIKFQCKHSTYLFSEGVVWVLVYENGSEVIITKDNQGEASVDFRLERLWNENGNMEWAQLKFFNRNIKQLSCLAPVWNSLEWWNSTMDLFVDESIPPKFGNKQPQEIVSSEGSQVNLTCEARGYPKPVIYWRKDGKKISETNIISIIKEMHGNKLWNESTKIDAIRVSSILTINVTQNTAGNYICTAKSDVGEDSKTFVVKIKDSTTTKVLGITAGVILILLLILGFSLRKIIQQRKAIQFLTQQEIEEFEKGNPDALAKLAASNEYTNNAHHLLPYNTDYEVPKDMLFVDYGVILGQGTYGMVLKGKLKRRGEEFEVAVKTIKPNEEASHFKVLLCEVKIMAYIGSHPNIMCLVGAYTRNIRNRELLVATEFCENGSLLQTLRNARDTFSNNFRMTCPKAIPTLQCPNYVNDIRFVISTQDLLKWAAEIATGMEFLGVKRVIHGDLACRNVLLGANNVAKVGDFGLSKHLFQYSTYQKKTVQLLPWRWMAFESLTDMVFSLQSDVWAYGVTLWEIFTLAQTPYPGMTWDEIFIKRLEEEYRLHQPQFASNEIYELILSCWVKDPVMRPSFTALKEAFYQTLISLDK